MSTATSTEYRKLTQQQLTDEARARFGTDPMRWAFQCPACGDVAALSDFKAAGASPNMAGQQCIGRALGALKKPKPTNTRGCDWAAYGLIRGPWEVVIEAEGGAPERSIWGFPLAPATAQATPADPTPVDDPALTATP